MKQKGITILEISMGLVVVLPLLFYVFFISGYLLSLYDVSRITKQIPKELSSRAVTLAQSSQSTNIDDAFRNNEPEPDFQYVGRLRKLVDRAMSQLAEAGLPEGTSYCVSVGAIPVEIDNISGKALPTFVSGSTNRIFDINLLRLDTKCIGSGDSMESTVTNNLKEKYASLISAIISGNAPIPSPFAIPSGLRGLTQKAYLGKSQVYIQGYNTATSDRNTNIETKFLERTMVFGASFGFDFSNTSNGKSLKYFTETTTSNRFKRFTLPRDFYSASLMYPRAEL